jgi:hypothetical protein
LPKAKLEADKSQVDRDLDEIKARIQRIHDQKMLDPAKASDEIAKISLDLTKLQLKAHGINVTFDTREALVQLAALRVVAGTAGGTPSKKGGVVTSAESAIQTAAGAGGAGSAILGNIMSFFGGLSGLFGGGGAGGGGGSAAAAAASSGGGGGGISAIFGGGTSIAPFIVAGIAAAAPFIGQLVGGAIIGALGAGLAGMGIVGAAMTGKLTKPWNDFVKTVSGDMKKIGTPFVGPLTTFIDDLSKITNKMTPTFTKAMSIIGPALGTFMDAVVNSFGQPAVQTAILAVANAFAVITAAVTPQVSGDMTMIANSIATLANDVAKNPQAMADVFQYLVNIVNFLISAVDKLANAATAVERWNPFGGGGGTSVPAPLTPALPGAPRARTSLFNVLPPTPRGPQQGLVGQVLGNVPGLVGNWGRGAADLVAGLNPVGAFKGKTPGSLMSAGRALNDALSSGGSEKFSTWVAHYFDDARHAVASFGTWVGHTSVTMWNGMTRGLDVARHNIAGGFDTARHTISHWFDNTTTWIQGKGTTVINSLKHGFDIGWRDVTNFFTVTIPQNFTNWFKDAGNWLVGTGKTLIGGFSHGISVGWTDIVHFFTVTVPGYFSTAGSWFADAGTWLLTVGDNIIQGLFNGIWGAMKDIGSWINANVVQPLITAVKSYFHISSPAQTMVPIGKQVITGIIHGMISEGKHLDKFVGDIFGSWPKALISFIGKGAIAVSKLPGQVMRSLMGAAGAVGSFFSGILGTGSSAGATSAGLRANGLQLYRYLLNNLFAGNKVAAAGAAASIWGESGWNPFAVGTGGRGLIGWTPAGTISNAAFGGGMKTQLPAIIDFVRNAGDYPAILAMMGSKSVLDAANIWGKRVERYGINDVHSTGVALATQFMKYDSGGWLPPGVTIAYNMTGTPERVVAPNEMMKAQINGPAYHAHFDGLTRSAIESHVQTAFQIMSIREGYLQRQGRRS